MTFDAPTKALLNEAITLFHAHEDPPDVEVSINWADRAIDPMALALEGRLEEVSEDILYAENDLFEDTQVWLEEAFSSVESQLNDQCDGSLDSLDRIEVVMAELRRQVSEMEIDSRSCCPVPMPHDPINLVVVFHHACNSYMSGLAELARVTGISHTLMMDLIPECIPNFGEYLQYQSVNEDFIEPQIYPDGDLSMLAREGVMDTNIGLCLKTDYQDLLNISNRAKDGQPFEIVIKNPVVSTYDGDSGGNNNCAGYIFTDTNKQITLPDTLLRSTLITTVIDTCSRRYREDCLNTVCQVQDKTPDSNDRPSMQPMKLIKAVLSGDPSELDVAMEDSEYLFKEMSLNDMVCGWNLMHYAAINKSPTGKDRMMRHLAQFQVDPNVQSRHLTLCPADLYLGEQWIRQRPDGGEGAALDAQLLQFFVDINANLSLGEPIEEALDPESALTLQAIRVIKSQESSPEIQRRKRNRL